MAEIARHTRCLQRSPNHHHEETAHVDQKFLAWIPAIDVVERHDAYLIALDLPGVDPSAIDVSFEQNVLTVRGSKPMGFGIGKDSELRVYSSERSEGNFERSVRLPEFVDGDKISAESVNGALFLTIPKVPTAQPRKITITSVDAKKIEK